MAIELDKTIFFHIPKTGGTFVTKVLKDLFRRAEEVLTDRPHSLMLTNHHVVPNMYPHSKNKKTFAFVRHPVKWYRSYWSYKMSNNWDMSHYIDVNCRDASLDNFIEKITTKYPQFYTNIVKEYEDVDFMGRQENLVGDLKEALTLFEEDADLSLIDGYQKINDSEDKFLIDINPHLVEVINSQEGYVIGKYYE